jgi:hypothetical protein
MISPIVTVDAVSTPADDPDRLVAALENGSVVVFSDLPFPLSDFEQRFVERPYADGKSKNVNIRGPQADLKGAAGTEDEQAALRALLIRYRTFAEGLIKNSFPAYVGKLTPAGTSYRPFDVDARKLSWRRDDTRLHVDAFPSNPIGQKRILRVFRNINAAGQPRVSARVLAGLGVTKALRSEYDHIMLHLHDALKRDEGYQKDAPQQWVEFLPNQTWVTFSDLVMHGAMGGRYMLEQTLYLPVQAQHDPAKSPQKILERKLGRALHA